jgi:hypothetical protein
MATRTRWRLDKIEYAVNGDSGIDEIYENLCGKTLEDIKSRLTAIKNIKVGVPHRREPRSVFRSVWSVHKKHDGAADKAGGRRARARATTSASLNTFPSGRI